MLAFLFSINLSSYPPLIERHHENGGLNGFILHYIPRIWRNARNVVGRSINTFCEKVREMLCIIPITIKFKASTNGFVILNLRWIFVARFQNVVRKTVHSFHIIKGRHDSLKFSGHCSLSDKGCCFSSLPPLARAQYHMHAKCSLITAERSAQLSWKWRQSSCQSPGRLVSSLTVSYSDQMGLHSGTRAGEPARPWTRRLFRLCDFRQRELRSSRTD